MTDATIPTKDAAELYEAEQDGAVVGGWTRVGSGDAHYSRQSRWHDRYWLVLRNADGETWGIEYGRGLTEDQENDLPWNETWSGTPVVLPLTRLHAHTVTRTEYRPGPPPVQEG